MLDWTSILVTEHEQRFLPIMNRAAEILYSLAYRSFEADAQDWHVMVQK